MKTDLGIFDRVLLFLFYHKDSNEFIELYCSDFLDVDKVVLREKVNELQKKGRLEVKPLGLLAVSFIRAKSDNVHSHSIKFNDLNESLQARIKIDGVDYVKQNLIKPIGGAKKTTIELYVQIAEKIIVMIRGKMRGYVTRARIYKTFKDIVAIETLDQIIHRLILHGVIRTSNNDFYLGDDYKSNLTNLHGIFDGGFSSKDNLETSINPIVIKGHKRNGTSMFSISGWIWRIIVGLGIVVGLIVGIGQMAEWGWF